MSRVQPLAGQVALVLAGAAAFCLPLAAPASSHREAPFITNFPKLDGTDLYMFRSYEAGRDGYVTLLANYYPFQDPYGGPNYFALDDTGRYTIRIDNDGDAVEDFVYIFQFDNRLPNSNTGLKVPVGGSQVPVPLKNIGPVAAGNTAALNSRETFKVLLKTGSNQATRAVVSAADGSEIFTKPVDFIGTKTFGSIAGYEAYARQFIYEVTIPGCAKPGRVFVGQRNEPFQINVGKIFDLVNLVPVEAGAVPGLPGIEQSPANDVLSN
ncbi:MAG: DUF4331 family protein, partial [Pseudomonadota bacterium]|nr:DUF4331 family protein [Pseudomonadota bacterium]